MGTYYRIFENETAYCRILIVVKEAVVENFVENTTPLAVIKI
jgi:hypothetical protein